VNLFISHTWGSEADYQDVIALIHRGPDFNWKNRSIPRGSPVTPASTGQPALQEEIEIRRERIANLECDLNFKRYRLKEFRVAQSAG
jgi:hypothetical protein